MSMMDGHRKEKYWFPALLKPHLHNQTARFLAPLCARMLKALPIKCRHAAWNNGKAHDLTAASPDWLEAYNESKSLPIG
jgi:hypothetical protein